MALYQYIGLVNLACLIWIVYDIFKNRKKMKGAHKATWILAGVLFSIITAIIYYFVVVKKK